MDENGIFEMNTNCNSTESDIRRQSNKMNEIDKIYLLNSPTTLGKASPTQLNESRRIFDNSNINLATFANILPGLETAACGLSTCWKRGLNGGREGGEGCVWVGRRVEGGGGGAGREGVAGEG